MKKSDGIRFIAVLSCSVPLVSLGYQPLAGDIVFHTSTSSQSLAVQAATGSPYSHMGIVLYQNNLPFVFEAVQPVKYTPLEQWLNRGKHGHYVVKRLRKPLTDLQVMQLNKVAQQYLNKSYDLTFEWSDQKIYCSELVWKMYDKALGIQLAPLSKLGDFNLSHASVKSKLVERYGAHIPLNEPVIAPVTLFNSPLLQQVARYK